MHLQRMGRPKSEEERLWCCNIHQVYDRKVKLRSKILAKYRLTLTVGQACTVCICLENKWVKFLVHTLGIPIISKMCSWLHTGHWNWFVLIVFEILRGMPKQFGAVPAVEQHIQNSLAGASVKCTIMFSVVAFVEAQKGRQWYFGKEREMLSPETIHGGRPWWETFENVIIS